MSAALVGAAMLSTLIFPLVGLRLRAGRAANDIDERVEAWTQRSRQVSQRISEAIATVCAERARLTKELTALCADIDRAAKSVCRLATTGATLTVGAVGPSLTYQWKKDGTVLAGATSASLTFTPARRLAKLSFGVGVARLVISTGGVLPGERYW